MQKILLMFPAVVCMSVCSAMAVNSARPSMSSKIMVAPRAGVMSKAQISSEANVATKTTETAAVEKVVEETPVKDMREKERNACINNNIGISNTFVWASRYSDTSNYATMVEDVEQPENNVCFVKAGLKSKDARIDVSDVPTKYFEMGQTVTCGSWANYDEIKQRILDAKKKGRALGTVATVVASAGVGVGAMELFGNKLIGGKVEGQQAMEGADLLRSQLLTLEKQDKAKYDEFITKLGELKDACKKYQEEINSDEEQMPTNCKNYQGVFSLVPDANPQAK